MTARIFIFTACIVVIGATFFAPASFAQGPTEEPTKRPYVFPTPIFIPTYADDTPTPRTTPSAPLLPGTDTYTVQSGDSPWTIAQKVYGDGTKYKLIMEANGLTDQTRLRVGMVLKIPSMGGNPPPAVPTAEPLVPTIAAPTPLAQPSATATTASIVTRVTSPTPSPATSNAIVDALPIIVNLISGVMFLAAIALAIIAFLRYERVRRLEQRSRRKQSLRIKE